MIKLKSILNELTGRHILHVYDFDDTLVKTNTAVTVIDRLGRKKVLSSHDFALYVPKQGDVFDFTEFDKIIKSSQPINANLDSLKTSLKNPNIKTTILTARRIAYPIMKHLRDKYGVDVYVVGVGDSNPELKADHIENEVKRGYNDVMFIDDSEKNLMAVGNRLKKYNINLQLINAKTGQHVAV